MRRPMAQHDFGWHTDAGQRVVLEFLHIEVLGGRQRMEFQIDQRRADIFHCGEALIEGTGGDQPL